MCTESIDYTWTSYEIEETTHLLIFQIGGSDELTSEICFGKYSRFSSLETSVPMQITCDKPVKIEVPFQNTTRAFYLVGVIYQMDPMGKVKQRVLANDPNYKPSDHYIAVTARKEINSSGEVELVYYKCDDLSSIQKLTNKFNTGAAVGFIYVSEEAWNANRITEEEPVELTNYVKSGSNRVSNGCFYNSCMQAMAPAITAILCLEKKLEEEIFSKDQESVEMLLLKAFTFLYQGNKAAISLRGEIADQMSENEFLCLSRWWGSGTQQDSMELVFDIVNIFETQFEFFKKFTKLKRKINKVCGAGHVFVDSIDSKLSYIQLDAGTTNDSTSYHSYQSLNDVLKYKQNLSQKMTMEENFTLQEIVKENPLFFQSNLQNIIDGIFHKNQAEQVMVNIQEKHNCTVIDKRCHKILGFIPTYSKIYDIISKNAFDLEDITSYKLDGTNYYRFEGGLGYGVSDRTTFYSSTYHIKGTKKNWLKQRFLLGFLSEKLIGQEMSDDLMPGSELDFISLDIENKENETSLCYIFIDDNTDDAQEQLEAWKKLINIEDLDEFPEPIKTISDKNVKLSQHFNVILETSPSSAVLEMKMNCSEAKTMFKVSVSDFYIYIMPICFSISDNMQLVDDTPFLTSDLKESRFLYEFVKFKFEQFLKSESESIKKLTNPMLENIKVENMKLRLMKDGKEALTFKEIIHSEKKECPLRFEYKSEIMWLPYEYALDFSKNEDVKKMIYFMSQFFDDVDGQDKFSSGFKNFISDKKLPIWCNENSEETWKHAQKIEQFIKQKIFKVTVFLLEDGSPDLLVIEDENGFILQNNDLSSSTNCEAWKGQDSTFEKTLDFDAKFKKFWSADFQNFNKEANFPYDEFKHAVVDDNGFKTSSFDFYMKVKNFIILENMELLLELCTFDNFLDKNFQNASCVVKIQDSCSYFVDGVITDKTADIVLKDDKLNVQGTEKFMKMKKSESKIVIKTSAKTIETDNVCGKMGWFSTHGQHGGNGIYLQEFSNRSWLICDTKKIPDYPNMLDIQKKIIGDFSGISYIPSILFKRIMNSLLTVDQNICNYK